MRTRRALLLTMLCAFFATQLFAQSFIGRQKVDQYPTQSWGVPTNGLTWLPTDYDSNTTKRYPVIFFLHGSGEAGSGIGALNTLTNTALPQIIANGWNPEAVNPADGKTYKFIVVSPQAPGWSYAWNSLQWIMKDVVARYRVDTTRIYVTGLSAGGAGTWSCYTNGFAAAQNFAAIVPVSAAGCNTPAEDAQVPLAGGTYGGKVWSVCGAADGWMSFSNDATLRFNNATPAPLVRAEVTGIPGADHTPAAWNTAYDPNWRSNQLGLNVYEWMLKYTRGTSTTASVPNKVPTVSAGPDQSISLPQNTTILTGMASDVDGVVVAYNWTKISGPAGVALSTPSSITTGVSGLTAGNYVFRLTVTDDSSATAFDEVALTVTAAPNKIPVVKAGNDSTIQLPKDSLLLQGSATDTDGTIAAYRWAKISGPSSYQFADSLSAQTIVRNLVQGNYLFELKATDNSGTAAKDTVVILVQPAANIVPVAFAGKDTTIQLPVDSILLKGTASDADGSIVSYLWTQVSGPAQSRLLQPAQGQTFADSLVAGVYRFQFFVTDNRGGTATDTVQVTVKPLNAKPVVNAGPDQSLVLPKDSTKLSGTALDSDGTITSYKWRKISGPAKYRIALPDSAQSLIDSLVQGYYEFELKAVDNQATAAMDTVRINVAAPPVAPCNGTKKLILPGGDGGRYFLGDPTAVGWYTQVNPGDTLVMSSKSQWSYFSFDGYKGTAACPIVIMNDSAGQVNMTAGISLNNCQYFKITGSGSANTFYGIYVSNPLPDGAGVAFSVIGKSKNVEIERTQVYKKTYGVWAKQDPQCDTTFNYPNYVMDSIEIHHSTFKNIGQDCIYAGNTDPLGVRGYTCNGNVYNFIPMRLSNINIHHLVIDSCNRTGIQLGGAERGYNQIHDNVVMNCGYEYVQNQGTGIAIGGMTRNCHVFNNKIKNTYLYGILSFGVGTNFIENNEIDSSGFLNGVPNPQTPMSIMASPKQTIPFDSTRIIIRNNKIGVNAIPSDDNHISLFTWGPATWATHNVVCGNTRLNGTTPAAIYVDPTIHYVSNCNMPLPNFKPTAFTGPNVTLVVPTDSTQLTGFGVDPDGTIVSYSWSQVSGPSAALLPTSSADRTAARNLTLGNYTFRVTVTDNSGATAFADMQVVVMDPNVLPTANAGADQTITLPINSITLTGSGTDADGTIVSYQWTKISGPASFVIANSSSAQTTVSGLLQGTYLFELTVTDNKGATAKDQVSVVVLPAVNIPPVASAGPAQAITLPTNSVTLLGSGTDADGSITAYSWTKVSGPSYYSFANAGAAQTIVGNLTQGIYQFELKVTDNNGAEDRNVVTVIVNAAPPPPPVNVVPVVNAGSDQTITLPANAITLTGSATDADGTITSILWTVVSGPAGSNISNPAQLQTGVNGLVQGIYQYELSATDNSGATVRDTIRVTVNAAPNTPPTAYAGPDQTITLPTNAVTLTGSASDGDGSIVSYLWTKLSGPAAYSIGSASTAQTGVTGLIQGTYQFVLTVSDNSGASANDTLVIVVRAAANIAPTVNAGLDINIQLPQNSVTLSGVAADVDGNIVSQQWIMLSGPSQYSIASPNQLQTAVTAMVQGVYQFGLVVTDNVGDVARDTITVTVLPSNIPPVVHAGTDQVITLPQSIVQLNGTATDADGVIATTIWTKISGPASGSIASPSLLQTTVSNLTKGVYWFELAATDNKGLKVKDTVVITVNVPPSANAGPDVSLRLPVNSVMQSGVGADEDGRIVGYQWRKISGPVAYAIITPNNAATFFTNMQQGVYAFELKVTDNYGATGIDTVQVTVLAANIPPVVRAGNDITITLPQDSTQLAGSGTDADGTIVSYKWSVVSGPSAATINQTTAVQTRVKGLKEGVYKFELTVTDNLGAEAKDTVTVTVNPDTRRMCTAELYPNPAASVVNVTINAITQKALTTINIYDMAGRSVYEEEFMRSQQVVVKSIDISTLKAGTYIISFNVDINKMVSLKFVKQ